MLSAGPRRQNHIDRLKHAHELSDRLRSLYGEEIVAIALYGSVARQQDGPYSDIEILCIIAQPDMDKSLEWIYGAGKAEINVLGRNDARWEAKEVDKDWAISKGLFLDAQIIFGDEACLAELRDLVLSISEDEINSIVSQVIVEELYEWIGKARNARHTNSASGVPYLACKFTEAVALILGLTHRTCYTTGMKILDESLQFDKLPAGYQELCNLVQQGNLSDPPKTIRAIEAAWSGVVSWATQRNIQIKVGTWPFSEKELD